MACTEEYRLGDFCRNYITCEEVAGGCQRIEHPPFAQCKSCVEACERQNADDPIEVFDCETKCREEVGYVRY